MNRSHRTAVLALMVTALCSPVDAQETLTQRIERILSRGARLRYVGRPESASPATGSYRQHEEETNLFIEDAFRRQPRPRAKKTRAKE